MNWSASVARAVLPSQLSGRFVKLEQTHSFSVHMISWQPVQVRDGWSSASVYLQSHVIPHFRSCPLSKVENDKLVQWIGSTSQLGCSVGVTDTTHKIGRIASEPFWRIVSQSVCRNEMVCLDKVWWNKGEPSGSVSYSEYFANCSNSLIWKWTIILREILKVI